MQVWRLVAARHTRSALSGGGAALYGGRWNSVGTRMVYVADSLALATLELSVHLVGAHLRYQAIELSIPDELVNTLPTKSLKRTWRTDVETCARIGDDWQHANNSVALAVPSALIDPRSNERNVLLNPTHRQFSAITEVQQFEVTLDERL